MTAPDLRALVRAIAEAAAPHVGARPSQTQHHVARHGPWSRWREEYVPASVARIEAALARQGGPCLVPYYGSESSHAGWSLDRPCGTLTRRDRFIVVVGDRARVLTLAEQRAIAGFPPDYPLAGSRADGVEQLGASVIPACAEFLLGRVLASVGQRRAGAQFSKARRQ